MKDLFPKARFWAEGAAQKRTQKTLFGELIVFFLVFYCASLIEGVILSIPVSAWMLSSGSGSLQQLTEQGGVLGLEGLLTGALESLPDWVSPVMLLGQVILIIVVIFYCKRFEGRTIQTLGLTRGHRLREYALGFALGALCFTLLAALGSALGAYRIGTFRFEGSALLFVLFILGFAMQGAAEELLVRGYLAVSLSKRYPVVVSAVISSIMYVLLHSGGQETEFLHLLNCFLFGMCLCLYSIKRGSLWGACAIHGAWNLAQACLLGFGVDSINQGGGLFGTEVNAYNRLLTGGAAGPDGSLVCTVILIAAFGAVYALKPRDLAPEPVKHPLEEQS